MEIVIKKATKENICDINLIEENLEKRIIPYNVMVNDFDYTNNYYFVALLNNKIVGYSAFSFLVDHIDIISIAVMKEYREKGIATKLLNQIFIKSQELCILDIFLEVRCSNSVAINFYEKNGFIKINTRKAYYKEPVEDAYIYKRLA